MSSRLKSAARSTIRLAYGATRLDRHLRGGWLTAHATLRSGKYSAVSIDCFDTILSRWQPEWEQRAIAALAIELADRDSGSADAILRRASVSAARTAAGGAEPSALAIWRSFCGFAGLPGALADVLCRGELELLEASSALEDKALDFICAVIDRQLPLVVCSDTRWPAVFLCAVLQKKGLKMIQDALVCSCDYQKSKFRGDLFGVAKARLSAQAGRDICPANILHIGDSRLSDIYSGASFGLTTILVDKSRVASIGGSSRSLHQNCLSKVRQDIHDHVSNR